MTTEIRARLADTAAEVEEALAALLPSPSLDDKPLAEARVIEAMRYACQGGKRLRAFLALETAAALGVERARAMRVACAIECIHAYSLVHDDFNSTRQRRFSRGMRCKPMLSRSLRMNVPIRMHLCLHSSSPPLRRRAVLREWSAVR